MAIHGEMRSDLPAVDERLVAPESRFEIVDGRVVYVSPADEAHAVGHGALGALLRAHRSPDRSVAIDMLTRTSVDTDAAPDASVYPSERDPKTGGRQLEELAFELLSTERLSHAGDKAARLVARGVRRVFVVDVVRRRGYEWSHALASWTLLAPDARIEDPALAVPLAIAALVDAVGADDASVKAYRAQRHPEFLAEHEKGQEQGRKEGLDAMKRLLGSLIADRGFTLTVAQEAKLAACSDFDRLERWLRRAPRATTADEIFADEAH